MEVIEFVKKMGLIDEIVEFLISGVRWVEIIFFCFLVKVILV